MEPTTTVYLVFPQGGRLRRVGCGHRHRTVFGWLRCKQRMEWKVKRYGWEGVDVTAEYNKQKE
mgnify:CR=1 FL=1